MDRAERNLKNVIYERDETSKKLYRTRENFFKICSDLVSGLSYLCLGNPEVSLIHGDIKPENILLMNGDYLISDFGTSKVSPQCLKSNIFLLFNIQLVEKSRLDAMSTV